MQSVSVLPAAGPYSVMANVTGLTALAAASQVIYLGANQNGSFPTINIGPSLTGVGTSDARGIADCSIFAWTQGGRPWGYCSFDAHPNVGLVGQAFDHHVSFQARPIFQGGSWNAGYGFASLPSSVSSDTHIPFLTHFFGQDLNGPGTVDTQIMFLAPNLVGAAANYSLLSQGAGVLLDHAGPMIGRSTLTLTNLPTGDPHVVGGVWNSGGNLKISAG